MSTVNASNVGEGVAIAILFVAIVFLYTITRLKRHRAAFAIGLPITVAFAIRLLGIVAINATGLGASLRGGDEQTFLYYANVLAKTPFGHGYLPHGVYQLHVVLFAIQIKLGFINETGMRVTQAGIALMGFIFMLAATYDLAGPRAARYAAWFLAFEPSSIFFNTEIHKEPLMELAAGLCAFGGVWMWKRLDLRAILIFALGCAIGVETRSYAGWFMACGCVLLILHAALRNSQRKGLAFTLVYAVVIAGALAAPTLLSATSGSNLKELQASQAQNSTGIGQGSSNLKLEAVDISSRSAVITSLPTKIRELLLEPYPWQLHDTSQAFGSLGTLVAYFVMLMLIRYAWRSRGEIFARAGPLLYPLLFEMVAYAVTVGNAGTGFRYRSHLVTLGICAMSILRARVREQRPPDGVAADAGDAGDLAEAEVEPVTA